MRVFRIVLFIFIVFHLHCDRTNLLLVYQAFSAELIGAEQAGLKDHLIIGEVVTLGGAEQTLRQPSQ